MTKSKSVTTILRCPRISEDRARLAPASTPYFCLVDCPNAADGVAGICCTKVSFVQNVN